MYPPEKANYKMKSARRERKPERRNELLRLRFKSRSEWKNREYLKRKLADFFLIVVVIIKTQKFLSNWLTSETDIMELKMLVKYFFNPK